MSAIEQHVARTLDSHRIRSTRIVVAVSGGADSMALLHALHALRHSHSLDVHAAHLNHSLRGAESDADAEWVAAACADLDVPCSIERRDVRAASNAAGTGIEETARNLRYEFLTATARSLDSPWVALAHNADDQVETVLHRIIRGTGLAGLSGMPVSRPLAEGIELIRPLLGVSRATIENALREAGRSWREDATNALPEYTRNRIRRTLLPLLRAEFNPQVDVALLRLARQADDARQIIDAAADDLLLASLLDAAPDSARIDCPRLAEAPPHLIRALLQRLWRRQNWPESAMSYSHWDRLAALTAASGAAVQLPGGITASRRGQLLRLARS